MVTESERQAIVDEEHLRMLPVFYWVLGAMDILFASYGLIYVGYGVIFLMVPSFAKPSTPSAAFPAFIGWFMIAFGVAFMLGLAVSATLKILTGFWIKGRRRRVACLIIAGLSCLMIPFGTIVGVFSYIVLLRPSVAAMFATPASPAEPSESVAAADVPGDSGDSGSGVA